MLATMTTWVGSPPSAMVPSAKRVGICGWEGTEQLPWSVKS